MGLGVTDVTPPDVPLVLLANLEDIASNRCGEGSWCNALSELSCDHRLHVEECAVAA